MPIRLLSPRALPGLLIIALGCLLLAQNFGLISLASFQQLWPLLLIALGLHLFFQTPNRALGIALAVGGMALQLDALGWVTLQWRELWRFWPVILIAVGAGMLLRPATRDNLVGGSILTLLGAFLLARNLDLVRFQLWDLWPIAVIIAGIAMLRKARRG